MLLMEGAVLDEIRWIVLWQKGKHFFQNKQHTYQQTETGYAGIHGKRGPNFE